MHGLPQRTPNFRPLGLAGIALLAVIALPAAGEAHDCLCRSDTSFHPEGSVVCLRVNGEERLARCERVLNNTSWHFLGKGCPVAAATALPMTAAHLPLAAPGATTVR